MGRIIVKTQTPGWFEDPETGKKTRKQDGDTIVDTKAEASALRMRNGEVDQPTTKLDSGKLVIGKTVEITCCETGCKTKRRIKPQDKFQVKRCVFHQKEHTKKRRREKMKAKRKAKAAASSK